MQKLSFFLFFTVILSISCSYIKDKTQSDTILAKVGDKELRLSALEGMLPEGTSKEDSSVIIQSFVTRWVKDILLMNEAENNIPKDLEIDKLVREYRTSLILNSYQEHLVKQSLDTVVTMEELKNFYESNKSQYELERPLIRCYMLKIPKLAPNMNEVEKWWDNNRKEDRVKLTDYATRYGTYYTMIDSVWYRADRIAAELPKGTIDADDPSTGESTRKDDNFYYYLRILGVKRKRDYAPFEYIKDQATTFILQKRKQKLIDNQREQIYQNALSSSSIKLNVQ